MSAFLVLLIPLIGILTVKGAAMFKASQQSKLDSERIAYELTFPNDLKAERIIAFLRAISAVTTPRFRLTGVMSTAYELHADHTSIRAFIRVPAALEGSIIRQLGHIPGLTAVRLEEPLDYKLDYAVEVGMNNPSKPLEIKDIADVSTSILRSLEGLGPGEYVVIQLIVSPVPRNGLVTQGALTDVWHWTNLLYAPRTASSDELNARRKKVEEPNFRGVLRVGTRSGSPDEAKRLSGAKRLVARVRDPIAATGGNHNKWVPKERSIKNITKDIRAAHSIPVGGYVQLATHELAALIAWRIDGAQIAGMPSGGTRPMIVSSGVSSDGRVIGVGTHPNTKRRVAVSSIESCKHFHIVGRTGCLHPDTPVSDPVDGSTLTVRQRYELGKPFHVWALDGTELVIAPAMPPTKFKRVGMYKLTNGEHSVIVTGQHRVWNGSDYVETEQLGYAPVQLPSISERDLSRLHEDAQRLRGTAQGSRCGCHPSRRSCGLPLPGGSSNGQYASPSLVDARAHGLLSSGSDASETKRGYSRPCRESCLSANWGSSFLASRDPDSSRRSTSNTFQPTSQKHASHCKSDGHCTHICTTLNTGQSVLESTAVSPSVLPFNQYFHNTTFRVEPDSVETYYDFHVPGLENYLAAGLIHHNSGKTALMANLAAQDVAAGAGMVVIDPKGELVDAVINYVPRQRLDDVVVFDVNDTTRPVGFNMLSQGSPQTVAFEIQSIFDHIYRTTGQVTMPEALYHLVIALMTTNAGNGKLTFLEVMTLIAPKTREDSMLARAIVDGIPDPYIKGWFHDQKKKSSNEQAKQYASLRNRIWQFMSRHEVRNIIGQSESSIDLHDIVKGRKILLVNLKGLPEDVAALIGSLIVNNLWHVAKAGYTSEDDPFSLYLDEFQHFVHSPIAPETLLAEGRSFGLRMHLAHQGLDQLAGRKQVEDGVMNNAVTKIVFQRGRKDASTFAQEFGSPVTDDDLKRLGKFEFIARVAGEDGISPPFTGKTLPPYEPFNYGKEARRRSRLRYGRDLVEVDEAIRRRRQVAGKPEDSLAEIGEEDYDG